MLGNFFSSGIGGAAGGAGNALKAAQSNKGFNFMDFLKGTDASGTPNVLSALGTAGALYGAISQQNMAKKMLKQQQEAFNFNKMLSQRQINRENQANQNLINAWNSSNFQKSREEEQ